MRTEFEDHVLNETGRERTKAISAIFNTALTDIEVLVLAGGAVESRDMALTRTHLQIAAMFAKKAISNQPINCIS